MTMEKVGDLKVTGTQRIPTPLNPIGRGGDDNNMYYNKAELLILEDGATTVGCTFNGCMFTADNPVAVASGHWPKVHATRPDPLWEEYKDLSMAEILGLLDTAQKEVDRLSARLADTKGTSSLRDENKQLKDEIRRLTKDRQNLGNALQRFIGEG